MIPTSKTLYTENNYGIVENIKIHPMNNKKKRITLHKKNIEI